MSLYALTASGLTRIRRAFYGTPIPTELQTDEQGNINPIEGGKTTDPGVQEFVNDLVAGFSSQAPIPLPEPLQFIAPANAPTIIIRREIGDGGGGDGGGGTPIIQFITNNNTTVTNIYNDGTITTTTTPDTPGIPQLNPTPPTVVVNPEPGFTGTLTMVTGVAISVSGCTVTVNQTTQTLTFSNGKLTSSL